MFRGLLEDKLSRLNTLSRRFPIRKPLVCALPVYVHSPLSEQLITKLMRTQLAMPISDRDFKGMDMPRLSLVNYIRRID